MQDDIHYACAILRDLEYANEKVELSFINKPCGKS